MTHDFWRLVGMRRTCVNSWCRWISHLQFPVPPPIPHLFGMLLWVGGGSRNVVLVVLLLMLLLLIFLLLLLLLLLLFLLLFLLLSQPVLIVTAAAVNTSTTNTSTGYRYREEQYHLWAIKERTYLFLYYLYVNCGFILVYACRSS